MYTPPQKTLSSHDPIKIPIKLDTFHGFQGSRSSPTKGSDVCNIFPGQAVAKAAKVVAVAPRAVSAVVLFHRGGKGVSGHVFLKDGWKPWNHESAYPYLVFWLGGVPLDDDDVGFKNNTCPIGWLEAWSQSCSKPKCVSMCDSMFPRSELRISFMLAFEKLNKHAKPIGFCFRHSPLALHTLPKERKRPWQGHGGDRGCECSTPTS